MMKSVKMFLTRIARLSMTDNVTKFQRSNVGQSTDVNATLLTSKSVTPPMDKNAPPSTRRSVRRLGMKSNAMTFQNKTVARSPRRIVVMFLSRFVTSLRRKSVGMSQELNARRLLQDNVVQSPGNTASMFLTSVVTKFPRLNAMTPTLSIASRFLSKTAERSQEDIVS